MMISRSRQKKDVAKIHINPNDVLIRKIHWKPSFVIVNVHHSIQENEIKEELLSNNGMNVVKVSRIISRASGRPTKLIRVITDSTNHLLAAQRRGVNIGW